MGERGFEATTSLFDYLNDLIYAGQSIHKGVNKDDPTKLAKGVAKAVALGFKIPVDAPARLLFKLYGPPPKKGGRPKKTKREVPFAR